MKKLISLVLAVAMVLGMMSVAFAADDPEYQITVENDKTDKQTINGIEYKAYKVFDLTLGAEDTSTDPATYGAYAYSIKNTDWAWTTLTTGATTDATTKVITTTYGIKLTPSAADPTVYTVDGEGMTGAQARSLADALAKVLPDDADGSAIGANEKAVIGLQKAGWYAVYGLVTPTDPENSDKTVVAALGLTTTDKKVTVNPKASVPEINKKITKVSEGTTEQSGAVLDTKGQAAVAKVGSTVSYQIDATTPDLTGYEDYTYIIGDKLTAGLDYVKTSFKLTIDGTNATYVTEATEATNDNELIFASGDKSFTLTIPYSVLKTAGTGKTITLTYDCTVNNSALTYDYENNTADLEYSRNPYDDDTNKTPEKKTYVIDLNIDVDKIGNGETTKKLAGAEFKLYRTVTTSAVTEAWIYDGNEYSTEADAQAAADAAGATDYTGITHREAAAGSEGKEYYKWADNKVT